jgi:chromosome segregation ATPase
VKDFSRRIIPVFAKVQCQKSELERLQHALTQAQCDLYNARSKNKDLNKDLREAKQLAEKATQCAEEARQKWDVAEGDRKRLEVVVEKKDKEIWRQKGLLDGWAKKV